MAILVKRFLLDPDEETGPLLEDGAEYKVAANGLPNRITKRRVVIKEASPFFNAAGILFDVDNNYVWTSGTFSNTALRKWNLTTGTQVDSITLVGSSNNTPAGMSRIPGTNSVLVTNSLQHVYRIDLDTKAVEAFDTSNIPFANIMGIEALSSTRFVANDLTGSSPLIAEFTLSGSAATYTGNNITISGGTGVFTKHPNLNLLYNVNNNNSLIGVLSLDTWSVVETQTLNNVGPYYNSTQGFAEYQGYACKFDPFKKLFYATDRIFGRVDMWSVNDSGLDVTPAGCAFWGGGGFGAFNGVSAMQHSAQTCHPPFDISTDGSYYAFLAPNEFPNSNKNIVVTHVNDSTITWETQFDKPTTVLTIDLPGDLGIEHPSLTPPAEFNVLNSSGVVPINIQRTRLYYQSNNGPEIEVLPGQQINDIISPGPFKIIVKLKVFGDPMEPLPPWVGDPNGIYGPSIWYSQ